MSLTELSLNIPTDHVANVFGQFDAYIKKIERTLNVTVVLRGESMKLLGEEHNLKKAEQVFLQLIELSKRGNIITEQNVNYALALSEEEKEAYDALLDISGTGVMGYIEIPTVNISLLVYHGTEDAFLQIAVGHLEWSSLAVGGESTHCVLSGHRGLPSAKLFTNLDKLVAGDKFIMRVLDEVLTYEVDQILIVEPTDVSTLMIEAGKDLCTLVTCTPYGINSHRLLVRGHRIENQDEAQAIRVTSDAIQIEPLIVAPAVALPMLLVLLVILLVSGGKTKSAGGKKNAKTE